MGVGFLGIGQPVPPHQLGSLGSAVCSPSGVRGGTLATKRFSCILQAPDGLSWNLLGAKLWEACFPWPPKSVYALRLPLLPAPEDLRLAIASSRLLHSSASPWVWVWGQKFRPRGSPGLCRGYGDPHGDSESPWGWVWGGYGDRNSVPTAALPVTVMFMSLFGYAGFQVMRLSHKTYVCPCLFCLLKPFVSVFSSFHSIANIRYSVDTCISNICPLLNQRLER